MSKNIAVIGCGAWGRNLVRNFYELGALRAIVEKDPVIAESITTEYGVVSLPLEAVLADPEITGVVCALAARQHYEVAKQILEAGKHLFLEKPMTLDLAQAQELVDLADRMRCALMVGHLPRYHPAFQRLVALVNMGEVGDVRYIYSHRLGLGRIRGDENCLWDLAPHDLSMIMAITDQEPSSHSTNASGCLGGGLVDTAMVHLTFANGIKGHIFNSWMHPFKEHRFVVIGTAGMLVFDDCQPWENKLVAYHHVALKLTEIDYMTQMQPVIPLPVELEEPLKVECQHFLDCIANNEEPLTGPVEALRVMKVLEQIQPSNRDY